MNRNFSLEMPWTVVCEYIDCGDLCWMIDSHTWRGSSLFFSCSCVWMWLNCFGNCFEWKGRKIVAKIMCGAFHIKCACIIIPTAAVNTDLYAYMLSQTAVKETKFVGIRGWGGIGGVIDRRMQKWQVHGYCSCEWEATEHFAKQTPQTNKLLVL